MGGVYMFTYVHICVGVKGELWVFSSITVYLIFETRSLNLSSTIRIRLAIQQAPRIFLYLSAMGLQEYTACAQLFIWF